jgi:hypothetical protein
MDRLAVLYFATQLEVGSNTRGKFGVSNGSFTRRPASSSSVKYGAPVKRVSPAMYWRKYAHLVSLVKFCGAKWIVDPA